MSIHALADDIQDPTRPPTSMRMPAHEPTPVLSAIMGVASSRCAIFNGQVVHAGSHVGNFFIEAVLDDGVRYRHAGASQELHMAHSINSIKKPSATAVRAPSGAP